ncbi:MAG: carbohydrate binding family 9 domain-containing protein [Acidobacteria bacterium]|nr:carbohydrate binding family 9 domain-containing protein [Acidobacteriota bacterium]
MGPHVAGAAPLTSATALKLDGDLSDEAWRSAEVVIDFRQRDPKEDAEPSFKTEARVAYDAAAIYVAVQAYDPEPGKIVGFLTRRDNHSPSDWIRVMIDSYHDRRTAYEFAVNPAGVKQDRYYFNDGNEDLGWDAIWDVAVSRNVQGWRAEFRIPFSQLRFPVREDPTVGFAIMRTIARLNEVASWPLIAKSRNGFVSQFGQLNGLRLSHSPKRLELVPYTVANLKTEPPASDGNPLVDTRNPGIEYGLDLKYAVTPGLTLTATVNPDFGQVEADPAVVNLSGFETFFSEQRPFFIEGSGSFSFDLDCNDGSCTGLFYSRRIGRQPRLEPEVGDGAFWAKPAQTTILGAAKLTGRVGGFRIGALNALTSEEHATIAGEDVRSKAAVEPFTSFSVARAKKEFANQSSLGFMFTSTNRALGASDSPLRALADTAVTGGVDWDWRVLKKYAVTGYWAGSTLRGDPGAIASIQESTVHSFQRPDAGHVEYDPTRTSLSGNAGFVAFSKISGERIRFNANAGFKSPGFDINDIGFIRRADAINQSNWIQFRFDRPGRHVRSFRFNLNEWSSRNFDGDLRALGGNVNAHWTLVNNWSFGGGVNGEGGGFDDRLTRGGPGGYTERGWNAWSYVNTDNRRRAMANGFLGGGRYRDGSRFFDVEPGVTYRPASFLSVSASVGWSPSTNPVQWVEQDADGQYVFGRLRQRTVSIATRVNYTITPTLSVQIYARPFVSAGEYTNFRRLADGRSKDFGTRYADYPEYDGNPDFNYRSFRTTNVLRWEYRPGSSLFVVWQQGRESTASRGDFEFGRDFGRVFDTPASNVFLVKMSYWLNF